MPFRNQSQKISKLTNTKTFKRDSEITAIYFITQALLYSKVQQLFVHRDNLIAITSTPTSARQSTLINQEQGDFRVCELELEGINMLLVIKVQSEPNAEYCTICFWPEVGLFYHNSCFYNRWFYLTLFSLAKLIAISYYP